MVTRSGQPYFTVPLAAPGAFEISWIHSVEDEEWREGFVADGEGNIRIESSRFRTFGAGMPDDAPEVSLENGWVVMGRLNRVVDPLIVRANTETAHVLTVDGQPYPLPEGQYRFEVLPNVPDVSVHWEYRFHF